jgi:NAD(P)-dependent dehydrogenase (short-subunit alcohol dehydrogenase family)
VHPDFDLGGRAVLVTGANTGIGLGIADALSRAGADVAIWGRDHQRNAQAEAQLRAHGGNAVALACDIAEEGSVEAAFAATVEALGRVDVCFANAGIGCPFIPFVEQTLPDWQTLLGINLLGTFLTLRAATRHMLERDEGGSLIGVSTIGAVAGMARAQGYAASKAGIGALMGGLAVELGRYGIRANTILPGFVETSMTSYLAKPKIANAVLPRIPAGRWGMPSDFGGIAVYLASDASRYHSGDQFCIDGGYLRF